MIRSRVLAVFGLVVPLTLVAVDVAKASDWTDADTARQVAVTTVLVLDAAQTRDIKNYSTTWETNPMLGKHPSDSRVRNYFVGAALGHYAVSRALPAGWPRQAWQYGWIAIEVVQVVKNKRAGFRMEF